jgi:soluble lytic murein transglycosylase-like protein
MKTKSSLHVLALVVVIVIGLWAYSTTQQQHPAASHSTTPQTTTHQPHTTNDYVSLARQDATAVGISPDLFVKQIYQESGFNPQAQSSVGAEGIAQFMPATAAGLGIDPWNPVQALQGAAKLMASYVSKYGSYDKALAAYNAGPGQLVSAVERCGTSWQSCLPVETQHYIAVIAG